MAMYILEFSVKQLKKKSGIEAESNWPKFFVAVSRLAVDGRKAERQKKETLPAYLAFLFLLRKKPNNVDKNNVL
jgi:hypothetical protein